MEKYDAIDKFRKIHGHTYDYSKVHYKAWNVKVCIICHEHGEFWQTPNHHLNGCGCPKCSHSFKADTNIFIEKARTVHGDKYDYSKVKYVNCKEKVCIICPVHGEFWQTPDKHTNAKQGCPICTHKIKHTNQTFIENAKTIHNDKYDYSKVEYVNNRTKVCIICPEHGEFCQTPANHLKGQQCPKCSGRKCLSNVEIIEKAKKIHGNKYDYSKLQRGKTLSEKGVIVCPIHGEFLQRIDIHLNGMGCPKCAGKYITTCDFINESKKIHGDKYDYSKSIYKSANTKIIVTCPLHGDFETTPKRHIRRAQGCPICNCSHLEEECRLALERNNISFIVKANKQIIPWIGKKHLDFYLPEYDIAIECQGEQHFKSIDAFGGLPNLKEIIRRDREKKELCENNNIDIVYFTNKDFLSRNKIENFYENKIYSDINIIIRLIKSKKMSVI